MKWIICNLLLLLKSVISFHRHSHAVQNTFWMISKLSIIIVKCPVKFFRNHNFYRKPYLACEFSNSTANRNDCCIMSRMTCMKKNQFAVWKLVGMLLTCCCNCGLTRIHLVSRTCTPARPLSGLPLWPCPVARNIGNYDEECLYNELDSNRNT